MKNYIIILFILAIFATCSKTKTGDKPIARVYDKYLYADDIKNIVPRGTSKSDSISKVNNYIDIWVKKQLLIKKAEELLSDEQKDVEKQIEDYRASLLIFKYKQKITSQKLDTIVTAKEIEEYYNTHKTDFKLNNHAIKGVFIKILKSVPEAFTLQRLYKSDKANDSVQLDAIGKRNAIKYSTFNGEWISFNDVLKEIPYKMNDQKEFLTKFTNIETQDSLFLYMLNIKGYQLKGDFSPVSIVRDNIKSIILNKRKVMLIEELEKNIYQNALNNNKLEFFNEKK